MRHVQHDSTPDHLSDGPSRGAGAESLHEADRIDGFGTDVPATLSWAVRVGAERGVDRSLSDDWSFLAAVASRDVGAARILEPHLDALDILDQAGRDGYDLDLASIQAGSESSWGVFAAEGAGMRLEAHDDDSGWRLTGTKPWCSLAQHLTHALVTAWVGDARRLFAVAVQTPEVTPHTGPWHARGLRQVVSAPVDFAAAPAVAVGEPGWYLRRPGFAAGGIGVAACWWGGALPLRDALAVAAQREGADQLSRLHLGRVDAALWTARLALRSAAQEIGRLPEASHPATLAARVRAIVAGAVETALAESARALGPLPLVGDEAHARRVADLEIYLSQHHGDRDLARIGADIAEGRGAW
ncbi:acyl-CoA dehydrogenase family protein [Microbacterium aquilitoris]|uniref:acyl-CoA dehydrogenase family protein n=1 Tax=Microbacterium aquilitoris TaxID=3067307 RepID=UPI00288F4065|nr:acyl-CoA dehydrogenase family protein [Microbacterium sp. KSW2-22]MDT3346068.1 acyl-CoA dehydrogenase family protein [Microbacterium sp. KSW2-22]